MSTAFYKKESRENLLNPVKSVFYSTLSLTKSGCFYTDYLATLALW
jgi:hypothetical protein